jgi:hypothetical protein
MQQISYATKHRAMAKKHPPSGEWYKLPPYTGPEEWQEVREPQRRAKVGKQEEEVESRQITLWDYMAQRRVYLGISPERHH